MGLKSIRHKQGNSIVQQLKEATTAAADAQRRENAATEVYTAEVPSFCLLLEGRRSRKQTSHNAKKINKKNLKKALVFHSLKI